MTNMNLINRKIRFRFSIVLSALVFITLIFATKELTLLEKVLISFNAFIWTYVFLLLILIKKATAENIKKFTKYEDESTGFLVITSITSALIALIGIAFELVKAREITGLNKEIHLLLPTMTLIGIWILIPTLFAIHYAHLYYSEKSEGKKIIKFPDDPINPNYVDFLYFSITISAAAQTADISITNSLGRKLVLLQTLFAFAFNTSILALGINVAASLFQ